MNTIGNKHTEVTMKATDLRIGNLVLRKDLFDNKQKFKETIVCHNAITACYPNNDNFQPIPLTEEWLLKFGFEKQENNWKRICICNDWTYLYWERLAGLEVSVNKHSIMLPHINSVHQLQNLYYALTNEELTYDPN